MRFAYLKDPLFLFCLVAYFVNRWVFKPYLPNPFSFNYLNDLICIPFWVPIMLFIMRKLRLRMEDGPPAASEILVPLLIWSWAFEAFLPHVAFFKRFDTADYVDILCYSTGALVAGLFWKSWYGRAKQSKTCGQENKG
jgi:hypothetical protein